MKWHIFLRSLGDPDYRRWYLALILLVTFCALFAGGITYAAMQAWAPKEYKDMSLAAGVSAALLIITVACAMCNGFRLGASLITADDMPDLGTTYEDESGVVWIYTKNGWRQEWPQPGAGNITLGQAVKLGQAIYIDDDGVAMGTAIDYSEMTQDAGKRGE